MPNLSTLLYDISELPYIELKSFTKCKDTDLVYPWKLKFESQYQDTEEWFWEEDKISHHHFLFNINEQKCTNSDDELNHRGAIQEFIKYVNVHGIQLLDIFVYHEKETNRSYFCCQDDRCAKIPVDKKSGCVFLCYRPYDNVFFSQVREIESRLDHLLNTKQTGVEFVRYLFQKEDIKNEFKIKQLAQNVYVIYCQYFEFCTVTVQLIVLHLTGSLN